MPTKRNPKWRARLQTIALEGKNAYSKADIEALAQEFDIPANKVSALKEGLEGAALVYRIKRQSADRAPRQGDMKAAIFHLQKHASQLSKDLTQLDDWSASAIWSVAREEYSPPEFVAPDDANPEGGIHVSHPLTLQEISASVNSLVRYCDEALEEFGTDPGGAPKNRPMDLWAKSIARLWTLELDRPLTINADDHGNPTSEAARFAWAAFEKMEHRGTKRVAQSSVLTALRKARKATPVLDRSKRKT